MPFRIPTGNEELMTRILILYTELSPFNLLSLQGDGLGSSVGIAAGYGLDGPGIESQWGARFSPPVQTVPGAHPASCKMGTGFFPGVKSGRDVTLTPSPPSSAVVRKE